MTLACAIYLNLCAVLGSQHTTFYARLDLSQRIGRNVLYDTSMV